jgi:hypothetical protein
VVVLEGKFETNNLLTLVGVAVLKVSNRLTRAVLEVKGTNNRLTRVVGPEKGHKVEPVPRLHRKDTDRVANLHQ